MTKVYSNETELLKLIYDILKSEQYSKRYIESMRTSDSALTAFMSDAVGELADWMGMKDFAEYYTIDHALYFSEDRVSEGDMPFGTSKVKGTWLKRIRVAFEHENRLDSAGGYQEIAKFMLLNADMKVLMGYADKGENYDAYAMDYQRMYGSVTTQSTPILFIGEYLDGHADAYLITVEGLMKYDWDLATWNACS